MKIWKKYMYLQNIYTCGFKHKFRNIYFYNQILLLSYHELWYLFIQKLIIYTCRPCGIMGVLITGYLWVQTVGPSKLFLFYDPVSIFESMHIVWRKSCLNEKIPDPVRTKCCWLLLLYTVNDHLISAKRSKRPFPFSRGI